MSYNEKREFEQLEKDIARLENEQKQIEEELKTNPDKFVKIDNAIKNYNKSFIKDNCQKLNLASKLSAIDTAYFFTGNLVLWLLNMNYPIVVLIKMRVAVQ